MQLNMQASPIGMASASQADFGGFDSRRLLHVSWIKMLSTAKTSEKHRFPRFFAVFRAKTVPLRTFQTGFDFVLSFDRFSCKTGLEPCDFFGDQILFRKFLKIATKFLTGEWHMIIMIIELSVIRLS